MVVSKIFGVYARVVRSFGIEKSEARLERPTQRGGQSTARKDPDLAENLFSMLGRALWGGTRFEHKEEVPPMKPMTFQSRAESTPEDSASAQGAKGNKANRTMTGPTEADIEDVWRIEAVDAGVDENFERLRTALPRLKVSLDGFLHAFRGMDHVPPDQEPTHEDRGPRPKRFRIEGRYNGPDESPLYLADSKKAVLHEKHGSEPLWMQEFRLPLEAFRIADVSGLPFDDFVNRALWWAEFREKPDYKYSRLIAAEFRMHFDVMFLYGVRGNGWSYRNILIFAPDSWEDWLYGEPVLTPRE